MTTPPRVVIDCQTSRHEVDRLVNVAHAEARRRKRVIVFWRVVMIAFGVIGTVAAFALGVAVMVGAIQ